MKLASMLMYNALTCLYPPMSHSVPVPTIFIVDDIECIAGNKDNYNGDV